MAGRKRNSAEDIVRELRRADELTAAGKTQEEIAAELEVSACRRRRCTTGGVSTPGWTPMPRRNSRSFASRTASSNGCSPRPSWRRMHCGR